MSEFLNNIFDKINTFFKDEEDFKNIPTKKPKATIPVNIKKVSKKLPQNKLTDTQIETYKKNITKFTNQISALKTIINNLTKQNKTKNISKKIITINNSKISIANKGIKDLQTNIATINTNTTKG